MRGVWLRVFWNRSNYPHFWNEIPDVNTPIACDHMIQPTLKSAPAIHCKILTADTLRVVLFNIIDNVRIRRIWWQFQNTPPGKRPLQPNPAYPPLCPLCTLWFFICPTPLITTPQWNYSRARLKAQNAGRAPIVDNADCARTLASNLSHTHIYILSQNEHRRTATIICTKVNIYDNFGV